MCGFSSVRAGKFRLKCNAKRSRDLNVADIEYETQSTNWREIRVFWSIPPIQAFNSSIFVHWSTSILLVMNDYELWVVSIDRYCSVALIWFAWKIVNVQSNRAHFGRALWTYRHLWWNYYGNLGVVFISLYLSSLIYCIDGIITRFFRQRFGLKEIKIKKRRQIKYDTKCEFTIKTF